MMFFYMSLYIFMYKLTFIIIYMTRINASSKITSYSILLTLYGPNSFFRRFSGHNLRKSLFVYRLIGETLIGNFFLMITPVSSWALKGKDTNNVQEKSVNRRIIFIKQNISFEVQVFD